MLGSNQTRPVARPLSFLAAVVVALAAVLPSPVARAASDDCEGAWGRLTSWSVDVERVGVDLSILNFLNDLTPVLSDCYERDSVMGGDVDLWRPLVGLYFDSDDVDRVMCLMAAESGGNTNAVNPTSGAAGLMQVMPWWADVFEREVDDLYDPGVNLWISSEILGQQGWHAWSPYVRGSCQ